MLKKFFPVIIVLFLISVNAAAAVNFPDMQPDHWAYNSVMTLVGDGTIGGYDDGTFQPNNTVTRAEFVKMIGKSNIPANVEYKDVPKDHWAYDYIMNSGLDGITANEFMPDTAITRNDVAQLIWKRNGAKKGLIAPYIITKQGSNKDAIAWVYNYGIMIGDDGINLRLNDTLSRAEAAVLITRARAINDSSKQINFVDVVSDKALEAVYNGSNLFDSAYEPDKNITNGELSLAAMRYATSENDPSYRGYSTSVPFEHKYAMPLYVLGKYCIGEDKVTAEYADKNATVQDVITDLTYGAVRKSNSALSFGDKNKYYSEISNPGTDTANSCLTLAYKNGVTLYANGIINPGKEITKKELAAILIQLDSITGVNSSIALSPTGAKVNDEPMKTYLADYSGNYLIYQNILNSVPKSVYEAPFDSTKAGTSPKKSFNFAQQYSVIFTNALKGLTQSFEAKGISVEITYYPSMTSDNGNGFTMRVKYSVTNITNNMTYASAFGVEGQYADKIVEIGTEFYADVITGQIVNDTIIQYNKFKISKIISIIK